MVTLVSYYVDNEKYDKLLDVSINSFKYFHKNDSYRLIISNKNTLSSVGINTRLPAGILKFISAFELAKKLNINKIIILGADTIICSRLDEFLENQSDILATLDYPYTIPLNFKNSNSENHVNADVVCFNNIRSLENVIELCLSNFYNNYFEQGALNDFLFSGKHDVNFKIVDHPHSESKIIYNVRAKGNILAQHGERPWLKYIQKYKVIDDKLFSWEDKQIKVFHYGEGFGNLPVDEFKNLLNWWIFQCFNDETKQFFTKISNSDIFYKGV